MDKPKPPILDYAVRKVMPMSQKVLIAATAGGAIAAIAIAGAIYRPVVGPKGSNVRLLGDYSGPLPTWVPATQPTPSATETGENPPLPPDSPSRDP